MNGGMRRSHRDGGIPQERHGLEWHAFAFTGKLGMAGQPARRSRRPATIQKSSGNPLSNGIAVSWKKKKKDDAASRMIVRSNAQRHPGSLMDTTTEVTSVSTTAVTQTFQDSRRL